MFNKTKNPYSFKYLVTGITGEGLREVYLPDPPSDDDVLFKKEQKYVRPEMSEYLAKEVRKWRNKINPNSSSYDPGYVSPLAYEIRNWEDTEWDRTTNGLWFWNNGVKTYITGFYAWYLSSWMTYFGYPIYRESDKEITYLLQYCEEDPDCYGLLLNTIRRYGKSSLMGGWATYRTTRNYNHYCGMQGEKDDKIAKFYNQMILKPFRKLPWYYMPLYDTSTAQKNEIRFEKTTARGKKALLIDEEGASESLESVIEYRPSGESEYDGFILNTYIFEEPGKTLTCDISERWKIVKPCLRKGRTIRGKAFGGTTVEFMDTVSKGGKAYKKLFYESNFDERGPDKRTKSGLYAAFLPGDCAYEDFLDEWGHPMREAARQSILEEREMSKDNPKDYSDLIRKYPLYIKEIFYINSDRCIFNATVLQDRLSEINMATHPFTSKVDFFWIDGVRFGKVGWRHNPVNGFAQISFLPQTPEECNLVDKKLVGGVWKYSPKNTSRWCAGIDPVDHRVMIEGRTADDDQVITTRRSKPVMFWKRKYDTLIDGPLNQDILEQRAREKYPYKTNRYAVMMDTRTTDPFVYYERALMICWFLGCDAQSETQKPGFINYCYQQNCEAFLQEEYVPEYSTKKVNPYATGTAANTTSINQYTEFKAWYIDYFGHTIDFRELIEDDMVFNPKKTTEFDYSVAGGWTEVACVVQPRQVERKFIDISNYLPITDAHGNPLN